MRPSSRPFKLAFFAGVLSRCRTCFTRSGPSSPRVCTATRSASRLPLLVSSILLFYGGIAFAYYFVFPAMFEFFATTTPAGRDDDDGHQQLPGFCGHACSSASALAFEVPVAVVLLVVTGIVKVETLKTNRGYVLIGIFVLAALLTPPDAISQCSWPSRCTRLYEVGILMARVMSRKKRQAEEASPEKNAARARRAGSWTESFMSPALHRWRGVLQTARAGHRPCRHDA